MITLTLLKQSGDVCVVGYNDGRVSYITKEAWLDMPVEIKKEAHTTEQPSFYAEDSLSPEKEIRTLTLQQYIIPMNQDSVYCAFDDVRKEWWVRI